MEPKDSKKEKFLKLIREEIKKLLKESEVAPAQPITKPTTKPTTRPLKIPKKWPGPAPKPMPKAGQTETNPTIAPPTTTPTPARRPLKIPTKWPSPAPKPMPKARGTNVSKGHITLEQEWRLIQETNRMKQLLREAPMDVEPSRFGEPHPSIRGGIEGQQETPFSAVELFKKKPLDKSTLEKLGEEEYNAIVGELSNIEVLNPMQIMNLVQMIIRIEQGHKSTLENLSLSIVQQKFGLPDDVIDMIKANLMGNQNIEPPEDSDDSPEEEVMDELTPEEQEVVKKHIDKRIVHNALMMGAGYRAHSILNNVKSSLDAVDDKLYPMYKKLMPNVEIFMWKVPVEEMFGQRQVWGKSELKFEKKEEETELKGAEAQAIMFPILLHEVAKAAVEILFAQHVLDIYEKYGEKVSKAVMKQSESYMDEHWMKLIGPRLWKYLHDAIDFVVKEKEEDYTIVAYVLNRMATMEPEEFMELMDNVLYNGDIAIQKIRSLVDEVKGDIENFENQQHETPTPEELEAGEEDHSSEIEKLMQTQRPDLEADLINKTKTKVSKKLEDMDIAELTTALEGALENEDYALAARIRDSIKKVK